MRNHFSAPTLLAGLLGMACASAPAAPFDALKSSNATAYRLQNFEQPATATPAPGAPAAPGALAIPGVPPEIMKWIQTGAQGLQALIPPIPGLPGLPGAPAAAPAAPEAPRFHNYKILGQTQIMDEELREKLGDLLGDSDSFDNANATCAPGVIYPEMGLSFSMGPTAQPSDVLISFSCNQVVSRSFAWPHSATGMKPETVKDLSEIVQKLWPAGT
jgi:hypothetical protein